MNTQIVQLNTSQTAQAAEILSSAFMRDPIVSYFFAEEATAKQQALKQLSRSLLRYSQSYDRIYTTADSIKGVALWLPPEASVFQLSQLWQVFQSGLLTLPFYARWDRILDVLTFFVQEIEQHRQVSEPFWYLAMLGVAPEYQGQGVGGALLQPVLQYADHHHQLCYLETSTEAAVRFYQRQGFEITHTASIAGNLPYWTMKRYPKA